MKKNIVFLKKVTFNRVLCFLSKCYVYQVTTRQTRLENQNLRLKFDEILESLRRSKVKVKILFVIIVLK